MPRSSVYVPMHLDDALNRFLLQLRANGRSEHTLAQHRRQIRLLHHWCATQGREPSLEQLDHETVASFLASPQALHRADGRPKQTSTVNALRMSLRGLFRYLHQAGHTQADLGRLIRPAMGGRSKPKALSVEDQHRLVGALTAATGTIEDRRDRALFLTMLKTGTRLNAVLQAEVEDLDLAAGELQLRRCKAGQEHLVFLPQDVVDALRLYLEGRSTGALFQTSHGRRITTRQVQRRLKVWLERAGCKPASPHALRHAFAIGLYRETRDVLLVRRALGHRSLASTLRYAEASDEELRAVIQRRM